MERPDRQVGDDEQREDDERAYPHRPPIADFLNQVRDGNWENNTPKTAPGRQDSEGSTALEVEPTVNAVQS